MKDSLLLNQHISEYLCSLEPDLPDYLENMYRAARENRIPVIRREAISLLRFLCHVRKPRKVLELGTATGFSSCFMAEQLPADSVIETVELYEERYRQALKNTGNYRLDYQNRKGVSAPVINCNLSDAEAYLKAAVGRFEQFDLVFLDAAKAQYPSYLSYLTKLLRPDSLLVCDNMLQEGSLAESKFTIERRDRTIHLRMRESADILFRGDSYESVFLPLGDGMTVSRLKEEK